MSKLVLISGLSRGTPIHYDSTTASGIFTTGSEGPASVQGFRVKSALGRQYSYDSAAVAATTSSGSVTFTANYPGTYGNNITVSLTETGSAAAAVTTTWAATTGYPTFGVAVPAGWLAWQTVAFINADEEMSQFVTASTTTPTATGYTFSATALAGGTNGTKLDAEPPYNVSGEPIWINVTDRVTVVVDIQDRVVQRTLQRNRWRVAWLGAVEGSNLT